MLYKLFSLMKHTQKASRDGWQWMAVAVIVVTVLYKINKLTNVLQKNKKLLQD